MRRRSWTWILLAWVPLAAQATDSPTLAKAIELFQSGRFGEVRAQLERLKTSSALSEADQVELRTYLAATHHALGDSPRASDELVELFRRFPSARVDPELFVPAVIDLAERARKDATASSPPAAPVADAPRRSEPVALTPSNPRPVTPWVWVPFGVGQFSRGENARGAAFLAAEGVLFLAAGVALGLLETSKVESYGFLRGGTFRDTGRAQLLNVTAFSTFWAGVAVAAWGVADAALRPVPPAPAQVEARR